VTRLVGAELLKLRTTRTFWALGGSAAAIVLLIVVLSLILDDGLDAETDVRSLLSTAGAAGLLTMVLGVVAAAGEYRHGTIASTLLVTPQRLRAVGAAVAACLLGGLAIGVVISCVSAAIALPWLSTKDVDMVSTGTAFELILGAAVFAGLAAALGAALGALVRNQVAAVVGLLLLLFVLDPAVGALVEDAAPFTLSGLSSAMTGSENDSIDLLPRGAAAAIWALYTVLIATLAAVVTDRRDI
jgi:ABC-2 type transport system permease protein